MKKIVIISALLMLTACATNSDIANLQTEIDQVTKSQADVSTQLAATKAAIADADVKAGSALTASEKALAALAEVDAKLDKLFKISQMK
jgi:uncharacterized protein involved in exopolysaccharide biosynthesis